MTREDLRNVLRKHRLWLAGDENGKRADLSGEDLQGVNLRGECLQGAKLICANLKNANLKNANLGDADLRMAYMSAADLRGANIDFSGWPLWCGSLDVLVDESIAAQLLYHWMRAIESVPSLKELRNDPKLIEFANKFKHVDECGKLEVIE